MATHHKELNAAEVSYAAINAVSIFFLESLVGLGPKHNNGKVSSLAPSRIGPGLGKLTPLLFRQVDKLDYIKYIKDIAVKEVRAAQMMMFSGRQADAEILLLQGGHVFRAIMVNIQLYRWDRYVCFQFHIYVETHTGSFFHRNLAAKFECFPMQFPPCRKPGQFSAVD